MSGIYASATVTRYNGSLTAPVQHCPGRNNKNKNINLHKSKERRWGAAGGHAALQGFLRWGRWTRAWVEDGGVPSDHSILTAVFLLKSCSVGLCCLDFCAGHAHLMMQLRVPPQAAYSVRFIEIKTKGAAWKFTEREEMAYDMRPLLSLCSLSPLGIRNVHAKLFF